MDNNVGNSNGNNGEQQQHKHSNSAVDSYHVSDESDVTDLQREKAQVELQMLRLKTNINAIEFQLNHNERVSFSLYLPKFVN